MNVVEVTGLTKKYGDFLAVDDLSFEIKPGEIYAFLGLNGAGKTTTIRMLLNLIRPMRGDAILFGQKLKVGVKLSNDVGYLVETASAYPDLTVFENLSIYFKYRGLEDGKLIDKSIQSLELQAYRNVKARNLSLGNQQRLGLAKATFHNPRLLILDEPTNCLDPAGILRVREMLKSLSTQGVTNAVAVAGYVATIYWYNHADQPG